VASGTSTVSHHMLEPVSVSKAYRARHLSSFVRVHIHPHILISPSVCLSPTTPPNARPLQLTDQCRSTHQVVQLVEVARTLARTSRLTTALLELTPPVYSLVLVSCTLSFISTSSLFSSTRSLSHVVVSPSFILLIFPFHSFPNSP
jgi:hypothetical protein